MFKKFVIATTHLFLPKDHENALISSYKSSFRITQQGEAHTIAESFIKPCAKDLADSMIGKKYSMFATYRGCASLKQYSFKVF